MIRLPDLDITLPEWKGSDFTVLQQTTQKLIDIGGGAGRGSDAFREACKRLLIIALRGEQEKMGEAISRPIDVRAFTFLLSSSNEFVRSISITRELLDRLLVPRSPLGKLALIQLIRAFFDRFDTLVKPEIFSVFCEFIARQLHQIDLKSQSSDLVRFAELADVCFSSEGPVNLVSYAKNLEIDLDNVIRKFGLTGFSGGRFLQLCRFQYYLDTLNAIPVGADDPVLSEVVKTEVANSPLSTSQQLGHAVLEILIDRTEGRPISQAWQNVILSIAGDPRVPKTSKNYQQWWVLLGEKRISLMRGWLSRFDLQLFLKILEQSARDGSVSDMERMFESRKIFMEGLVEQNLIFNSRLFLSSHAEAYLKSHFNKNELPEYARTSSPQTSMIYLNVAGKVHMIEGSHSFKLKLFDALPSVPKVLNFEVNRFEDFDFRSVLISRYEREIGNPDGYKDLTHDVHLNWQYKAIRFLSRMGVSVEVNKLISPERYREFKEKFGVF